MLTANLVTKENDYLTEDLIIKSDAEFSNVEALALKQSHPVCIEWRRSNDGQVAYWSPSGATLEPYFYNE